MIIHDLTHTDGSRSVLMRTPCGYDLVVMRTPEGQMKLRAEFERQPANIVNTNRGLSGEGAVELADVIKEIFTHA